MPTVQCGHLLITTTDDRREKGTGLAPSKPYSYNLRDQGKGPTSCSYIRILTHDKYLI